jgi:hypothetical protein
MRSGMKIVLKIRKIVRILVLASRAEDFDTGLMKVISLSTISPKRKLVTQEVTITAYWMACDT